MLRYSLFSSLQMLLPAAACLVAWDFPCCPEACVGTCLLQFCTRYCRIVIQELTLFVLPGFVCCFARGRCLLESRSACSCCRKLIRFAVLCLARLSCRQSWHMPVWPRCELHCSWWSIVDVIFHGVLILFVVLCSGVQV